MSTWVFRTVPEELLDVAASIADHLASVGYSIYPERGALGFPYTPTLLVRRKHTEAVVEVVSRVDDSRVREWVAYGRSTGRDFRVSLALRHDTEMRTETEELLRECGVGCFLISPHGVTEKLISTDLALNIELPDLKALPMKARRLLGPAYENFDRGMWREGFEEACHAFESEARRYLKRHCASGRVTLQGKKQYVPKASVIDRAPMGGLRDMFNHIISQNRADSLIGDTLAEVNQDRIGVVHHKGKKVVESRLRRNVGRHMWSLVNAFREVIK